MKQPSDKITAGELTTRYILSKRHFSRSRHRVKYAAYLPAPNGECSVFRSSNVSDDGIWEIGQKYVAEPTERILHARADTLVSSILKTGLEIVPETSHHPLHANIVKWPLESSRQKLLAIEIANEAKLTLPSD